MCTWTEFRCSDRGEFDKYPLDVWWAVLLPKITSREKPYHDNFKKALPYLLAVIASFIAAGIFIALMGFDVFKAFETILFTSFRTPNGFVQTMLKFVPLVLLALAFTIPLTAGKFNIGGEGQMMAGGIGAAAMGILFPDLPAILLIPLVILGGVVAGALWGLVPAWLLYKFNINEILTTVLFNFVAFFWLTILYGAGEIQQQGPNHSCDSKAPGCHCGEKPPLHSISWRFRCNWDLYLHLA